MGRRLTTEEWIVKARKVHGDKYDYSLVYYKKSNLKVKIICPIHGVFEQIANNHTSAKMGCDICSGRVKLTLEEFINRARKIHGDFYSYYKSEYINYDSDLIITCPKHGDFKQTPNNHITGKGCIKCYNERSSKAQADTQEDFLRKAAKIHGDRYNYDKVK